MMHKKDGFTLIELLAVISILAIIITIAATSISNITKKAKEGTSEEMRENLKDAGITYALESLRLQKCSEDFSQAVYIDGDISKLAENSSCAKTVSVSTLKAEGLFEDEKGYCEDTAYVIIYRYYDGTNSEYKAYVSDDACTNY